MRGFDEGGFYGENNGPLPPSTDRQKIAAHMRTVNAQTVQQIARAINRPVETTQTILHDMDDAGEVIMRNGFYRASEVLRQRGEKA